MLYNMNTCVYPRAGFPLLQAQMSHTESALAEFVLQNNMELKEGSFWKLDARVSPHSSDMPWKVGGVVHFITGGPLCPTS